MTGFFGDIPKLTYQPDEGSEFAFRHYNPDEIVLGKRLEDHLRFAIAYWHSFAWEGGDPFGGRTFERPWFGSEMDKAKMKAQKGKLPARERIARLLDDNTDFLEISQFAAWQVYDESIPCAGVIAGIGFIAGIQCMVIANDASVKGRRLLRMLSLVLRFVQQRFR